MKVFVKYSVLMFATAVGMVGRSDSAQAAFITTGEYDEQTFQANAIDTEATSNNLTLADFKTDVATAFQADLGGVIPFDDFGSFAGTSFQVNYGVNQNKTLTVTRGLASGAAGTAPNFNMGNSDATVSSVSGSAAADANRRYLASSSGDGSDWRLSFSEPLLEWGFTVLSRSDGANRTVALSIILDDNTSVPFTQETIAATGDDTFFSYKAPAGRTIKNVVSLQSGLMKWDDMGFIVVPEPSSILTISVGLIVLGRLRTKRRP